jgi:meiotic recombination protein SPO11
MNENILQYEQIVLSLLKQLTQNEPLTLNMINRHTHQQSSKSVSLHHLNQSQRFTCIVRIMRLSYELMTLNKYATKRDIYYTSTQLFNNTQSTVDEIIEDIAAMLQTSTRKLNVVASARGKVYGNLTFNEKSGNSSSVVVNCRQFKSVGGRCIPPIIESLSNFRMNHSRNQIPFVLVAEKDAVFTRLLQDGFCEKYACVLITSKGYPDVATRLLLTQMMRSITLHCFVLVDADPHGIEIAKVYKYGSQSMDYLKHELCLDEILEHRLLTNVHWIGLDLIDDFSSFQISSKCMIPITANDEQKIDQLVNEFSSNVNSSTRKNDYDTWIKQLKFMQKRRVKAEIQSLSSKGLTFLSDVYLPSKIQNILSTTTTDTHRIS